MQSLCRIRFGKEKRGQFNRNDLVGFGAQHLKKNPDAWTNGRFGKIPVSHHGLLLLLQLTHWVDCFGYYAARSRNTSREAVFFCYH